MWLTIYLNKKCRPNQERDEKFKPFVRVDYDDWSYFFTIFTHFFYFPRIILVWIIVTITMVGCLILSLGHKRSTKPGPIRRWLSAKVVGLGSRGMLLMYGFVWLNKEKVNIDYSKWLGPSW